MKKSRTLSALLVGGLVAGGSLLIASPAAAATTLGDATFYEEADFGFEPAPPSSYPAGHDWFFGHTGDTPDYNFDRTGLEINASLSSEVQILNQNVTAPATATDLVNMMYNSRVNSSDDTVWTLQFAFYADPTDANSDGDLEFTTLRPNFTGGIDITQRATDEWVTSWDLGTYTAGDVATLLDFADELYAGGEPEFLAYGLWVPADASVTVEAFTLFGDSSLFFPVPTRSISATTINVDDATDTGFTLTGTNWVPGNNAWVEVLDDSGVQVFFDASETVDANGDISFTVVLPAGTVAGDYTVEFHDGVSFVGGELYAYDVFAAPFEIELVETLAATGFDSGAPLALAGALMIGGVLVIITARMRASRATVS